MNNQSGTAQLRFLEETAIRLRQNGFTVEPIEDHHLPVRWEKGASAAFPARAACCIPPGEHGQYPGAGRFAGGDRHR